MFYIVLLVKHTEKYVHIDKLKGMFTRDKGCQLICLLRSTSLVNSVRAVNTLQQLLARCKNVMDAVKALWELHVDDVRTL